MSQWVFTYEGFNPDQEKLREALCTVGNGYFATRGAAPESTADDVHYPGTYLAGGYNRLASHIAGRTIESEDLVNMPNWLPLTFRIDGGGWFDLRKVEVLSYQQDLDVRRGVLRRSLVFRDAEGRTTSLSQRRFVHMEDPHMAGLDTVIVPEDWSGTLTVRSALDGRVINAGVERYRKLSSEHLEVADTGLVGHEGIQLEARTNQSHLTVALAARTRLFSGGRPVDVERTVVEEPGFIGQEMACFVEAGATFRVEKVVSLHTSRDRAISEASLAARTDIERAGGFDRLLARHELAWEHLWSAVDVEVDHADEMQLPLRIHIFHLLQTVSPHTVGLDVGVPARGWHGEAYRGHIFWDELFIFPFLNFRLPEITRALLLYRYRRLPGARWAAKEEGYHGAMYPWQSGSDGSEESQRLHLNPKSGRWLPDRSHRQRHISLAIAYNVWLYHQVTGDREFLYSYGAEMLIEIARFFGSLSTYNQELGKYEILGVMGPDEYHDGYPDREEGGLNNNAYTNVMAAWVLCRALDVLEQLPSDRRRAICEKVDVGNGEIDRWDDISRNMRVVFHGNGIISQFEGYEDLQEFDWDGYRERYGDIHRLDRILEAENDTPNRYKASKQADVVMLFYLFSCEELEGLFQRLGYTFNEEILRRNVDYYMQRTSHGSTLSRVVHSWVMSRIDRAASWLLFEEALASDLADVQGGTTPEGIHLGAMAGTADLVQRCFTGIEARQDMLWFDPRLAEGVRRISLCMTYHGCDLCVEVLPARLRIVSSSDSPATIRIAIRGAVHEIAPSEAIDVAI